MSGERDNRELVRSTGRGAIAITAAKVWFMVTGWALIFCLPRIFKWTSDGDPQRGQELFGAYKLVFMGISFVNNGIITGTIQAVSKFTSEGASDPGDVRRAALGVQGGVGVALAVAYMAFAGLLADLLGSPELAGLMRISAPVIAAYSCYAVFIGSFNGRRLYGRQALFDFAYSTVKVGLILGLAAAGMEVLGTVLGFLVAAVAVAVAAGIAAGRGGTGTRFSARRYLSFAAVLIVYTFALNLVMSLDLFLLKGVTAELALDSGAGADEASGLSKLLAGRYGAAQGLAFIPYQAVLAIAFVAFPMISRVIFVGDVERTRRYVRSTIRFSAILIAALASVFVALPRQALLLVFPPEYSAAAPALSVLAVGVACFGMMVIGNTILNGAGHPWRAMGVVLAALAAVSALVSVLVRLAGPGEDALLAAAGGTALGMFFGLALSGLAVLRRFRAYWSFLSALRVGVAVLAAVALGRWLPVGAWWLTLLECGAVLVVFFGVLVAVRELGADDFSKVASVLGKGDCSSRGDPGDEKR
ncbi:MAG: polysaccharide biosynthesis C-terminal domain-containing protein [Polyangia bacterium]